MFIKSRKYLVICFINFMLMIYTAKATSRNKNDDQQQQETQKGIIMVIVRIKQVKRRNYKQNNKTSVLTGFKYPKLPTRVCISLKTFCSCFSLMPVLQKNFKKPKRKNPQAR